MKLLKALWIILKHLMGLTANVNQVSFGSAFSVDQILGTFSGSFNAIASGDTNFSFPTNINDSTLFYGTWSLDGGQTWADLNSSLLIGGLFIGVAGNSTAGTFNLAAKSGVPTAYTITYNVALIAKSNQAKLAPQPIAQRFTGNQAFLDTTKNYLKIVKDGVQAFTVAASPDGGSTRSTNILTIPHNLGYHPASKVFIEEGSNINAASGDFNTSSFLMIADIFTYTTMDNNNTYIYIENLDTSSHVFNVHYRIYYDN